jgi:hypothetical protein
VPAWCPRRRRSSRPAAPCAPRMRLSLDAALRIFCIVPVSSARGGRPRARSRTPARSRRARGSASAGRGRTRGRCRASGRSGSRRGPSPTAPCRTPSAPAVVEHERRRAILRPMRWKTCVHASSVLPSTFETNWPISSAGAPLRRLLRGLALRRDLLATCVAVRDRSRGSRRSPRSRCRRCRGRRRRPCRAGPRCCRCSLSAELHGSPSLTS